MISPGIYTGPTWLVAIRERLLEFYSALINYSIHQHGIGCDYIQVLDNKNIFNACTAISDSE